MELTLLTLLGFGALIALINELDDDGDDGPNEIIGTDETDDLTGTEGADRIIALAGVDTISGNGGDDYLRGGDGPDLIRGGDGDDRIITDESSTDSDGGSFDVALGEAGNDVLRGGIETDVLSGGEGDDLVVGDLGDDWLQGDAGNDTLEGRKGADTLIGGAGSDTLEGGNGADILFNGEAVPDPITAEEDLVGARAAFASGLSVNFPVTGELFATDDGEADVLDGGAQNDILFLGANDTGTGGDGADEFVILDQGVEGIAEITDFDAETDRLLVLKENGVPDPVLRIEEVREDGLNYLFADDEPVASFFGPPDLDLVLILEAGPRDQTG